MTTIAQVADVLHNVFEDYAEGAARSSGFVQRSSKLNGPAFAQTLVFGWLGKPEASLTGLTQVTAAVGVKISNQGLDQRFTKQAAHFLKEILNAVVAEVIATDPVAIPVLQRFNGVILQDSSTVVLPNDLDGIWRGRGSKTGDCAAALKIEVRLDLSSGALLGPLIEDDRRQDKSSIIQAIPVPAGALRIADLGYFSLAVLQDLESKGSFYLTRLQVQTAIFDEQGKRLDLLRVLREEGQVRLDMPIQLGNSHRLRARLIAVRVPLKVVRQRRQRMLREAQKRGQGISKRTLALAEWTILVTNVAQDKLSVAEALALMHARWQIELLFKLWKQHGHVDEWRSTKPWRILCETYAKLIAMVVQHWLILVSAWQYPNRSLVKAAQTVRDFAMMLASAMAGVIALAVVIEQIKNCLASVGCRINRRKTKPNTYQLLLEPMCAA
jgi:hypothetical protein